MCNQAAPISTRTILDVIGGSLSALMWTRTAVRDRHRAGVSGASLSCIAPIGPTRGESISRR
jgi:hypothetical protein